LLKSQNQKFIKEFFDPEEEEEKERPDPQEGAVFKFLSILKESPVRFFFLSSSFLSFPSFVLLFPSFRLCFSSFSLVEAGKLVGTVIREMQKNDIESVVGLQRGYSSIWRPSFQ
jgi:hypothetical protein